MSNSVKAVKAIDDVGKIEKLTASIGNRGVSLARDIHTVAFSCLVHIAKHGDTTSANNLVAKLIAAVKRSGMIRSNAVIKYFEAYGPLVWDSEKKLLIYTRAKVRSDDETVKLLAEAAITPPEVAKPESEYKPFKFEKAFDALIEKAIKHLKEGGLNKGDEIDMELVAKLKRMRMVHNGLAPEGSPGFAPEIELGIVKVEPTQKVPGKSEPNGKGTPPATMPRSNKPSKAQQRAEAEVAIAA